jgi:hypothetical protein
MWRPRRGCGLDHHRANLRRRHETTVVHPTSHSANVGADLRRVHRALAPVGLRAELAVGLPEQSGFIPASPLCDVVIPLRRIWRPAGLGWWFGCCRDRCLAARHTEASGCVPWVGRRWTVQFNHVIEKVGMVIDAVGAAVIVVGSISAGVLAARQAMTRPGTFYRGFRQRLGKAILLGLELLVARTSSEPSPRRPTSRAWRCSPASWPSERSSASLWRLRLPAVGRGRSTVTRFGQVGRGLHAVSSALPSVSTGFGSRQR